jgi:hypothetical protein
MLHALCSELLAPSIKVEDKIKVEKFENPPSFLMYKNYGGQWFRRLI